jgi:hypothetical protein
MGSSFVCKPVIEASAFELYFTLRLYRGKVIFDSVQPFFTTLFRLPFPLPTPEGRRDSQFRTMPKREIECCARQHPGVEILRFQQDRKVPGSIPTATSCVKLGTCSPGTGHSAGDCPKWELEAHYDSKPGIIVLLKSKISATVLSAQWFSF